MLIVEGADGTGKTTLARELLRRLNELDDHAWQYRHLGLLPKGWDYYWDYLEHAGRFVVQDRFHMSEVAYGNVCRGGAMIDRDEHALLLDAALLARFGAFTVVLSASESTLRHRYRNTCPFTIEQVLAVEHEFFQIQKRGLMRVDAYGGTMYTSDVDRILDRYLKRQTIMDELIERGRGRRASL